MDKVDAYDKEQLQAMGWLFDEIETPMSNIGLDIMVVNLTNGSATLTQAQADALLASNGVIFIGSGADAVQTKQMKNRIFFRSDNEFYAIGIRGFLMHAIYYPSTRVITFRALLKFLDVDSVHYTTQTLTEAQQAQARENIDVKSESELATSDTFSLALTGNGTFITDLVNALDSNHYGSTLAMGADLQQGLLNDADFIAELKTKLGLT